MERQQNLKIIHATLDTGQCKQSCVNHLFQGEASHHPMGCDLTLRSRRSCFCLSCLLHCLGLRGWRCLMLWPLCLGSKEGHGIQFNEGWLKITIIICLISELVYDSLWFMFSSHLGSSASNQPTWSCSSLISLFLVDFCSFVHSPPTFLLWCVRTTVKITKQILMNHLLMYHSSSHLTPEYHLQLTP